MVLAQDQLDMNTLAAPSLFSSTRSSARMSSNVIQAATQQVQLDQFFQEDNSLKELNGHFLDLKHTEEQRVFSKSC